MRRRGHQRHNSSIRIEIKYEDQIESTDVENFNGGGTQREGAAYQIGHKPFKMVALLNQISV